MKISSATYMDQTKFFVYFFHAISHFKVSETNTNNIKECHVLTKGYSNGHNYEWRVRSSKITFSVNDVEMYFANLIGKRPRIKIVYPTDKSYVVVGTIMEFFFGTT